MYMKFMIYTYIYTGTELTDKETETETMDSVVEERVFVGK